MLGVGLFAAFWAVLLLRGTATDDRGRMLVGLWIALFGALGLASLARSNPSPVAGYDAVSRAGGLLGAAVAWPLSRVVSAYGAAVVCLGLTPAEKRGRELFGEKCAVCHTLAAANAIGKVGPNLDTLQPPYTLVLHTIENGCLQNPPTSGSAQTCLGQGTMPSNVVQGKDAIQVSQFVAKVAGKE